MAQTMICKWCRHPKQQHGMNGCTHTYKDNKVCACSTNRLDPSDFEMGQPLDN
jgi:hypothetical protein